MNVFGIGLPELIVILVVALLIFGPKKLPEIGRSLGKTKRAFEEASREFQDEMKRQTAALEQEQQAKADAESPREPSA